MGLTDKHEGVVKGKLLLCSSLIYSVLPLPLNPTLRVKKRSDDANGGGLSIMAARYDVRIPKQGIPSSIYPMLINL